MCPPFPQLPPSTKPFQEAQSELNQAAADLNQSAGEVVHATRGQSGELAAASGKFSDDFDEFLDAGIEMAGQAQVRGRAVAEWSWPLPLASGGLSAPEAKRHIGAGKLWTAHGFTSSLLLRELHELTGMAFPKMLLAYVWDKDDR